MSEVKKKSGRVAHFRSLLQEWPHYSDIPSNVNRGDGFLWKISEDKITGGIIVNSL